MTIELFDGNNVLLRDLLNFSPHQRGGLNLRKRYHDAKSTHFWCWDGASHNDRRKAIYPRYKSNREPMAEDVFAQIKLFREMMQHSPSTQIECPKWEADDIIGTLARKFAARGQQVIIHSNDLDYKQLTANPNITINGIKKMDVPGRWIPLYKACVGDSADAIAGIPGFGPGTWDKLDGDYEWLEKAIVNIQPHAFETLSLPKRVKNWLQDVDNIQLVKDMYLVTHILTVPDDELNAGITQGKPNEAAADQLLRKFFL